MKRIISSLLLAALVITSVLPVTADNLSEAKKKKESVDKSIDSLKKQKDSVEQALSSKKSEQKKIESIKESEEKELKEKQAEIKLEEEEIKKIKDELRVSDDNYNKKKELFKKRLKTIYRNADKSLIEVFVDSESVGEFFERIKILNFISKKDTELKNSLMDAKKKLEDKLEEEIEESGEIKKEATYLKNNLSVLEQKSSRAEADIKKYNRLLDQLEEQIDAQNKLSAQLASDINSMLKKGTKYIGGSMLWPVNGYYKISSYYGMRVHPVLRKYKLHTGIDIPAPYGTPILAANGGTVIISGWQGAYGYAVVVDHGGGTATLYGHASKLLVGAGDTVEAGQAIAKMGSTGYSTGPHLHFEVIKNGEVTDPLNYVSP